MADTAAWLVDRVFPDVPVRQWVLSLPHRVRWACAFDHRITQGVRRIFVRALASFYCRDAGARAGSRMPRPCSVVAIQRFDSALRLNVHLHSLWPDGAFPCALRQSEATFHPARRLTNDDVQRLVRQIRGRVLRYLRKTGKLTDADAADPDVHDATLFDTLRAAIAGRTALGTGAGRNDPRIGQGSAASSDFAGGRLCANLDGFSLHAAVRVDGCNRDRLERLCRYALRPPIVHERLSTHVVLDTWSSTRSP